MARRMRIRAMCAKGTQNGTKMARETANFGEFRRRGSRASLGKARENGKSLAAIMGQKGFAG